VGRLSKAGNREKEAKKKKDDASNQQGLSGVPEAPPASGGEFWKPKGDPRMSLRKRLHALLPR